MTIHLRTFSSAEDLVIHCLELLKEVFEQATESDGIMLAGGRSPMEIYRRAAQQKLTSRASFFLSDERYVPVSDPQSNYKSIAPFFPTLGKIRTERPIGEAAQCFDDDLRSLQRIPLGLLGLGADGHTASLFNLTDAALRDDRLAIPVIKDKKPDRISTTPALLRRIDRILILAPGAEKREMIQTLLNNPESIPAGVALAGHPKVEIWTD